MSDSLPETSIWKRVLDGILPDPIALLLLVTLLVLGSSWFWVPVVDRLEPGDERVTYGLIALGVLLTFAIALGGTYLALGVLGAR